MNSHNSIYEIKTIYINNIESLNDSIENNDINFNFSLLLTIFYDLLLLLLILLFFFSIILFLLLFILSLLFLLSSSFMLILLSVILFFGNSNIFLSILFISFLGEFIFF